MGVHMLKLIFKYYKYKIYVIVIPGELTHQKGNVLFFKKFSDFCYSAEKICFVI